MEHTFGKMTSKKQQSLTYLSLGVTSIQSFPIRTTGQLFLHSCLNWTSRSELLWHNQHYYHQCFHITHHYQQPPHGVHHASNSIYLGKKPSYLPPASLGFALVRGDDGDPSELVLLLLLLFLLRRHFASSEQRQGSSLGVVCNMNQGDPGYRARRRGLEGAFKSNYCAN